MDLRQVIGEKKMILLDGAMGTQLAARGLEMSCANNITHPADVLEIHRSYLDCGCDALITNTLTMNRLYLETHKLNLDLEAVNRSGVELARRAARNGQFVLGDMSATGQMLEPYGPYSEIEVYETFLEQAAILADAGVDGFILETFVDLREARCALRGCLDAAVLPVLVTLSFATTARGGRTIMGDIAGQAAELLAEEGACAVGANCGELAPSEMAAIMGAMRAHVSLPLIAQPNAGKPRLEQGRTVFDLPPHAFAVGILDCIKSGAGIVGGCCGTSPGHITAVARAIGRTLPEQKK